MLNMIAELNAVRKTVIVNVVKNKNRINFDAVREALVCQGRGMGLAACNGGTIKRTRMLS